MAATIKNRTRSPITLRADIATELMSPNPISIRADASTAEAIRLLTDKGISAAPVIDGAGRPVGVLSRADILVHHRETNDRSMRSDYYQRSDLSFGPSDIDGTTRSFPTDEEVRVADIMTPIVLSVAPDAPARKVVEDLVAYKVHRLFVVDTGGVLIGVISALDVLKRLTV